MAVGTSALDKSVSLKDSFFLNSVNTRFVNRAVIQKRPKYYLISMLEQVLGEAEPAGARKFEIYNQDTTDVVVATDSTSTATNGDLVVTLQDPDSNVVRNNDHVYDQATDEQGIVTSTQSGQVTVKPWNVSSFSGNTFSSGHFMVVLGDISPDAGSQGKETLNHDIYREFNYCGVKVESQVISRDDIGQMTWTRTSNDEYWALYAETDMMSRFSKNHEKQRLMGVRQEKNGRHSSGGLDWYVNNYGNTFALSSEPGESDLQNIMETLIREAGTGTEELTFLAGTAFIGSFQNNVVEKYVQPVGVMNTIGGQSISGISGYTYEFLGVRINMINYTLLDDKKVFPQISNITNKRKASSSAYILDTSPVESSLGTVSPFQVYYYGPQHMFYKYIPGTISPESVDTSNIMAKGYEMTSTLNDGFQALVLCDDGIELRRPEQHGKVYLSD